MCVSIAVVVATRTHVWTLFSTTVPVPSGLRDGGCDRCGAGFAPTSSGNCARVPGARSVESRLCGGPACRPPPLLPPVAPAVLPRAYPHTHRTPSTCRTSRTCMIHPPIPSHIRNTHTHLADTHVAHTLLGPLPDPSSLPVHTPRSHLSPTYLSHSATTSTHNTPLLLRR